MADQRRRSRFSEAVTDDAPQRKRTRFDTNGAATRSIPIPVIPQNPSTFRPGAISLNKDGKIVDSLGRELKTPDAPVSTVRVNQQAHANNIGTSSNSVRNAIKSTAKNPYLAHLEQNDDTEAESQVIDPQIRVSDRRHRGSAALQFKEPGSYIKWAEAIRAKEARVSVQREVQHQYRLLHKKRTTKEENDETGDAKVDRGKIVEGIALPPVPLEVEPAMEWWDVSFLPKSKRQEALKGGQAASDYDMLDLRNKASTTKAFFELVEHPLPVSNATIQKKPREMKMYHTKQELKKIRRKTRQEQRDEQNLRVLAGVEKAPPPKVRIKNMMRVLSEQAVADPSKIEQEVQRQVQQRVQNHDMRNLARMLTPEERKAKKIAKLQAEAQGPPTIAVFRVTNLSDPADLAAKRKFRIDATARSLLLTGGIFLMDGKVTTPDGSREGCNLVVAEGGSKAVKKFIKVMVKNIPWHKTKIASDSDDSDSEEDEKVPTKCHLVWFGCANKRAFQQFQFEEFPDSIAMREYLSKCSVPHYWDLCTRFDQGKYDSSTVKLLLG